MRPRLPSLAGALLLAGCATYHPQPLDSVPAVLLPPEAAVLEQAAQAIDRPFLAPVPLDLARPLDPNGIAVLAVLGNPDLKAQRLRAGVADAQAFMAGLLPDPTLSFGIDFLRSGPDSLDNLAASLGLDLNALRSRAVTRERARAEARRVRLDLAWAEWQTAGQARIQAARIVGLERSVELYRASLESARSMLASVLRAASRNDIDAGQVEIARIAAADAADRDRLAERELAAARFELRRLVGLAPDSPLPLAAGAVPDPPPGAAELFAIAERRRTDLDALRAGYAAQEAVVRKAVMDQFPTLDLAVNATRDTGNNKLLGPAVSLTLPLWNRNRGGIAVERATRAALRAEYDARLFQARAEIAAAVGGLGLAHEQRQQAIARLPELARFAEVSRNASLRGDLAPAAAAAAEQALRDGQALLAQSEQDIREQTIALELLTGALQEAWIQ